MRQRQDTADTLQPIDNQKTYPMAAFMQATGWGRHAMRRARQQGLRVVRIGGRCFVRGQDFSTFLATIGEDLQ